MKMELFDIDLFLKRYSKQIDNIETKQISDWIGCSVRYVQKYAEKNNIPFHRVNGRKYYIWNEEAIFDFMIWHNSRHEVKPVKRIIHKMKREKKIVKKEKTIPFKTIQDIVDENKNVEKEGVKLSVRLLQKWCKEYNVPYKYFYGHKYYIITDELFELYKLSFIEKKKQKRKDNKKVTLKIRDRDLATFIQIANEQK